MTRFIQKDSTPTCVVAKNEVMRKKLPHRLAFCMVFCCLTASLHAQSIAPGGVSGYTLDLWVDGDNSTANTWPNLLPAAFNVQVQGTMPAPSIGMSRFNFHQQLVFNNNKLTTSGVYAIPANTAYHIFVMAENNTTANASQRTLVAFYPTTSDANAQRACLQWNANNVLRASWRTGAPSTAQWNAGSINGTFGIASMSVVNNGTNANVYLNSATTPNISLPTAAITTPNNNRLMIGNGNNATNGNNNLALNGSIQEIIVLRGGAGGVMPAADIARIHSYLAIKYGITLEPGTNTSAANYVASDNSVVWDRTRKTAYNNHIFGIACDTFSRLNQMISRSANDATLTLYKGSYNPNSRLLRNRYALDHNTYIMLGTNNASGQTPYTLHAGDPTPVSALLTMTEELNYRSNRVWMAQIKGDTQSFINMRLTGISPNARFLMVSDTENKW